MNHAKMQGASSMYQSIFEFKVDVVPMSRNYLEDLHIIKLFKVCICSIVLSFFSFLQYTITIVSGCE